MTSQVVAAPSVDAQEVDPELELILSVCARPVSVAELASRSGFPLGVLRVLLADLLDRGQVMVHTSGWERQRPDAQTLRMVLERIREL
ncbi:putative Rossmann fold nucleotide-binding protein DprA/Smf involved in DNA uptake [Nocardiopsis terrae]|uniref:Rossmann fold nucleotide-binding protein DprA/Smf involved in DNA uptake n=2 Tax=Nocardiopsis terrae TaxID=372655 RepID=A0ABR9HHJ4_9ACTN|nr:putative Rossmann fold nucleotide-binding protein DprA/Smf involved in DNA uptake [Nocardiopsis terrae]